MANFLPSVLEAGQAKLNQGFIAKGEWRDEDTAALAATIKGGIASPQIVDVRTSPSRTVQVYMPIRGAAGSATARSINHTGSVGDSKEVTLSWNTFVETFSISLKRPDNNVLAAADIYSSTVASRVMSLLKRINAAFVTQLVADKTGVLLNGANSTFDAATDVYEVPAAQGDYFFAEIDAMNMQNRYNDFSHVICDSLAYHNARIQSNQGAQNSTNLAFQFGNKNILGTTSTILSGYNGSAMVFPADSVAYIPWIPQANRKALDPSLIENGVGDFGKISIPELGMDIAVHAYSKQANTSAAGGDVQDKVLEVELSVDLAYLSSPMSTTDESVVKAVGLVA